MKRRYSPEFHEFMRSFIPGHTEKEIAAAIHDRFGIDMTTGMVKSYKGNYGIRSGTPCGTKKGTPSNTFPQEIVSYIQGNHAGVGPKEMAGRLNRTFGTSYTFQQLKAFYANHKINSGLTGCFQKGNVPPNKGKKGMTMHPNAIRSQFKPGHRPANKLPIGTVLEKSDGYLWRKIGEGARDWRQEHVLRWEEAHGPIPAGSVITFLDGDKHNVALDNLQMISRDVNIELTRRKMRTNDRDLTKTSILVATIRTATRKVKKNRGEKKA